MCRECNMSCHRYQVAWRELSYRKQTPQLRAHDHMKLEQKDTCAVWDQTHEAVVWAAPFAAVLWHNGR